MFGPRKKPSKYIPPVIHLPGKHKAFEGVRVRRIATIFKKKEKGEYFLSKVSTVRDVITAVVKTKS